MVRLVLVLILVHVSRPKYDRNGKFLCQTIESVVHAFPIDTLFTHSKPKHTHAHTYTQPEKKHTKQGINWVVLYSACNPLEGFSGLLSKSVTI